MTREIAFDTETTGLSPQEGHRVIELGCVEMVNAIPTGNHFHVYINPEREVDAGAVRVHGLDNAFLADKPLFADIVQGFLDFIGDARLVIHNAPFDMGFINAEFSRLNLPVLPMERAIDTLQIARRTFPGAPASLDALCRRFTIDLSARTKHGALLDAELLAEVYLELTGGRQSSLLTPSVEESEAAAEVGKQAVTIDFPRRHFPVSAQEKAAHADFLERIGSAALWNNVS